MKKRILSLILVVVMLALTLTSCSYSFAEDNMSNYVTFDSAKFNDALKALVLEDGDFTTDEAIRAQKVEETIRNTIGQSTDTGADKQRKEGIVGTYDILYYSYYVTATFGEEVATLYASNMKSASAVKLQLGMNSTASSLDKAIMDALKDKDIKDFIYSTDTATTTELKAGDKVYVSYTYDSKDASGNAKPTVKVTSEYMVLGDDAFSKAIIENCAKVGTKKDFKITVDGEERDYKNVVVDWVVTSSYTELGAFEVKDLDKIIKDYNKDTTAVTDTKGVSRKLGEAKDGVLTYHVFPVYYVETAELSATLILDTLLGKSITKDLFEVFGNESYKATVDGKEKTLATLVTELAALCSTRDTAKTTRNSAESTLSTKKATLDAAGANATAAQKQAVTDAEKALKEAQTKYDEAVAKVDSQIKTILAINADLETKIVEEFREMAFDTLENEYNNEIYMNAAKAVWALIESSAAIKSYPAEALEEMKDRILDKHEYTFYNGTKDTTKKISYYKHYNGSFEKYLIGELASGKTIDDAYAVIEKEAKAALDPIIKIFAVSEALGCEVSDKDFKEEYIKSNAYYESEVEQYGELNVRAAYQFDTLLGDLLECETYEKDEGDHKAGDLKDYIDGKYLPFKKIAYTIKADAEAEA